MTPETVSMIAFPAAALAGLVVAAIALLRGWQGWLDLKRMEMAQRPARTEPSAAMERIEIADLRERVRKLESIASCVDL